jgi:MYXO-CTERM domain-containing protein
MITASRLLLPLVVAAPLGVAGCVDSATGPGGTQGLGIVGGTETDGWPAIGCYMIDAGNAGLCTATLVRPDVLLTAAHCADGAGELETWTNAGIIWEATNSEWWTASEVHLHPLYEAGESYYAHDLAVLILDDPITSFDYIPVNTVPLDHTWREKPLHYVGYGSNSYYGGPGSGTKRETDIEIYDYYNETVTTHTDGTNTCTGDSGGPALVDLDGHWHVVGVNSWVYAWEHGQDSCNGASVAMRVDHELDFLSEFFDPYETPYPAPVGDDDTGDPADDDDTGEDDGGCQCRSAAGAAPAQGAALLGLLAAAAARRRR